MGLFVCMFVVAFPARQHIRKQVPADVHPTAKNGDVAHTTERGTFKRTVLLSLRKNSTVIQWQAAHRRI